MKLAIKFLYLFFISLLVCMLGTLILSTGGKYKMLVVQSGSMEPSIKRLSVVFIKPMDSYKNGDIITVKDFNHSRTTTTHRLINIEEKEGKSVYTIKGDANNAPDSKIVTSDLVIGKVISAIPYLGYPITLVKTIPGFILMVILPALIIISNEIIIIKREIKNRLLRPNKGLPSALVILIVLSSLIPLTIKNTNSYLVDREMISGNSLTAGIWPALEMKLLNENKEIKFIISNISAFKKISYELIYDSDFGKQGVTGSTNLHGESEFTRTITLGTCSTGGACTYHTNVTNIHLHIDLEDKDGNITALDNSL